MAIGIPLRRPRQKTAVSSRLVRLHSEFQTSVSYEVRLSKDLQKSLLEAGGGTVKTLGERGSTHTR